MFWNSEVCNQTYSKYSSAQKMLTSVNEWKEHRTLAHFYTLLASDQLRTNQMALRFMMEIFRPLYKLQDTAFFFFISTRQNILQARMHTSHLHTGARKCIPSARVAIWWQAVGGSKDESCQWQPLKRTTHLSSRWRGMMDDYLKVWQVRHRWGSSHFPSLPPICLSLA